MVFSAGEPARMAGVAGRLVVRRGLRCCCAASCGLCRVPANAGASALSEGAARTRARRRSRTNGRDQPLPASRDTRRERVSGPAQARGRVSDACAARRRGIGFEASGHVGDILLSPSL